MAGSSVALQSDPEMWRAMTYTFAKAMFDKQIQEQCENYDCDQRKNVGVADHPFSLMEGVAGDLCFLSDLIGNEYDTRFPGYEVLF